MHQSEPNRVDNTPYQHFSASPKGKTDKLELEVIEIANMLIFP